MNPAALESLLGSRLLQNVILILMYRQGDLSHAYVTSRGAVYLMVEVNGSLDDVSRYKVRIYGSTDCHLATQCEDSSIMPIVEGKIGSSSHSKCWPDLKPFYNLYL